MRRERFIAIGVGVSAALLLRTLPDIIEYASDKIVQEPQGRFEDVNNDSIKDMIVYKSPQRRKTL